MAAPLTTFSITAPGFFGLNTQDSPVDMDQQFSLVAQNCVIDKSGRVGCRKGWSPYHSVSAELGSNNPVEALGELVSNSGSRTTLAAGNSKLFKVTIGSPNTLTELTYGGGGVAPTISANRWQMVMLNGAMMFWQRGHDPLLFDPALSSTTYRRLSEHPLYAGSAPQANCALSAYGRIWVADTATNKNTLYWSDTLTYMKWTGGTAGSLDLYGVWPQGGDEIVAIAAHNNNLIIFGRNQTLVYSNANDPASLQLQDVLSNSGCLARDSVANTPSDVIYLSDNGVTSIKRTIQEKSAPISNISRNVNDDVKVYAVNASDSSSIKGVYSPIDSFYLLTFGDSNITYCFDMRSSLPDGSSRATTWTNISPKCYVYSDDQVLRMGLTGYIGNHETFLDNTTAYRMAWYSSWIDFGDPIRKSILKKIEMTVFGKANETLTIKWGFDYQSKVAAEVGIVEDIGQRYEYNIAEYGIAEYSNPPVAVTYTANPRGAGKIIQAGMEMRIEGSGVSLQRVDVYTKNGAYLS